MQEKFPTYPALRLAGRKAGFTLVELMVSVSIFAMLLLIFTGLINIVSKAWESSKRTTEVSQNSRAVLSLLEQDLAPAVISDLMQMGQNPPTLQSLIPPGGEYMDNADSLFWWGPVTGSSQTGMFNLAQFGWYLSKGESPDGKGTVYNLNRYNRRFEIDEAALILPGSFNTAEDVYWFTVIPETGDNSFENCSRVVASSVIGFWVECLDRNGATIPPRTNSTGVWRFNSGERFQMAPAGQKFDNGKSFQYTAPTTVQAHALPSAVRVTILVIDEQTMKRHPDLPPLPPYTDSNTVAERIDEYRQELAETNIFTSVFTTTVKLASAP